ncbi:carbohydrate ABC transporter permease [Paenibacillus koleovorans]|uniref:carbohydrate ABC transporter permease n=1 Tax=Paenibacillus koleovorans TaxID=121608 RepID=UPI000FD6C98B|nr:carbohydrate ABC transporter permease [Paenibacillus koleovorans]
MVRRKTFGDICLDTFVYVFLILLAITTLFPFLNVFSKAVSAEWAVISGKVGIYPIDFQLDTMKFVVTSSQFQDSFLVSIIVTVVGTFTAIVLTSLTAYPLSKKNIPGIKLVLILFVFSMLFNGGMIPNYLLIRSLGLMDSLGALILPSLVNVFNLLLIKTYYENVPPSLEESASLDGASNLTILFRIIIPISKPVIATVCLFYAVSYWNDYINPLLYINSQELKPLQLYLRDVAIVMDSNAAGVMKSADELMNVTPDGVRAATIIASTVPILLVYPLLQRHFIKGIMIGSVKG